MRDVIYLFHDVCFQGKMSMRMRMSRARRLSCCWRRWSQLGAQKFKYELLGSLYPDSTYYSLHLNTAVPRIWICDYYYPAPLPTNHDLTIIIRNTHQHIVEVSYVDLYYSTSSESAWSLTERGRGKWGFKCRSWDSLTYFRHDHLPILTNHVQATSIAITMSALDQPLS